MCITFQRIISLTFDIPDISAIDQLDVEVLALLGLRRANAIPPS